MVDTYPKDAIILLYVKEKGAKNVKETTVST